MVIVDTSGDQKNNGNNNSADKKQSPPFVNRLAKHRQQQAKNSDEIPHQTLNFNPPNPHQIDSSTNRNQFAEYMIKRAGVVEQGKLPLPKSISFPPPWTLNSISSSSSKLVHSNSSPVLENKASVDPYDNGATTDDSSMSINPTTPLNSGKLKRKLAVPISTDLKATDSGKRSKNLPSSSSDAVMELQSIIRRAMLDGKFRSHCDDCGSIHHHCCVRTILKAITDSQ